MSYKNRIDCQHPWASVLIDIFDRAVAALDSLDYSEDAMLYGPAHIVWSDQNFELEHVRFCLKCCDEPQYQDRSKVEIEIVRWSLLKIVEVME